MLFSFPPVGPDANVANGILIEDCASGNAAYDICGAVWLDRADVIFIIFRWWKLREMFCELPPRVRVHGVIMGEIEVIVGEIEEVKIQGVV